MIIVLLWSSENGVHAVADLEAFLSAISSAQLMSRSAFDKKILQRNLDPGWHFLLVFWCLWCRLLCVEHIDKNGKPLLYLVFEYLDTDLKKYIDAHGRSNKNPLPTNIIKVMTEYKSCNTQFNLHRTFGFFCVFLLWKKSFHLSSCGWRCLMLDVGAELHVSVVQRSCTLSQPWCHAQVCHELSTDLAYKMCFWISYQLSRVRKSFSLKFVYTFTGIWNYKTF